VSGPADYEDGDVNVVTTDYDDGDVNVAATDYEDGDVNAVGDAGRGPVDSIGNRAPGGTPNAVLAYLARSLANEPASVQVDVEERAGSVRLRLHVGPQDMGRVIGRRGRTAQAIRALVGVAGARDGVQTSVDIVDD
jgi:hypothetical protein